MRIEQRIADIAVLADYLKRQMDIRHQGDVGRADSIVALTKSTDNVHNILQSIVDRLDRTPAQIDDDASEKLATELATTHTMLTEIRQALDANQEVVPLVQKAIDTHMSTMLTNMSQASDQAHTDMTDATSKMMDVEVILRRLEEKLDSTEGQLTKQDVMDVWDDMSDKLTTIEAKQADFESSFGARIESSIEVMQDLVKRLSGLETQADVLDENLQVVGSRIRLVQLKLNATEQTEEDHV